MQKRLEVSLAEQLLRSQQQEEVSEKRTPHSKKKCPTAVSVLCAASSTPRAAVPNKPCIIITHSRKLCGSVMHPLLLRCSSYGYAECRVLMSVMHSLTCSSRD